MNSAATRKCRLIYFISFFFLFSQRKHTTIWLWDHIWACVHQASFHITHLNENYIYIYIQFMTAITNSYNINNCWITFRHLMAIHTSIVYIFDVDGLCMHVIIQVFTSLTFSRRFDPIKFLYWFIYMKYVGYWTHLEPNQMMWFAMNGTILVKNLRRWCNAPFNVQPRKKILLILMRFGHLGLLLD